MKTTAAQLLILTGLSIAWLVGCAAPASPKTHRPAFAVIESRPAHDPLPASLLFTPAESVITYDIVAGDGAGDSITIRRERTDRFNAQWADDEAGLRSEFLRREESGDVVLTAAIDRDDSAITLFNPPLTSVYSSLVPGKSVVQKVAMRVMDLNNPRQQRESGTATQKIEHLGRRRVLTDSGEFTADCIRVHFEANLRMANAVNVSTYYVIEGLGIVAAEREEKITALGLFSRSTRRTIVRSDLAALIDSLSEVGR